MLMVIMTALLSMSSVTCFAEMELAQLSEDIVMRYSVTSEIISKLSIAQNGTATCAGKVKPKDDSSTCYVTTKLMKKENGRWKLVSSWSNSGTGRIGINAGGTKKLSAGTYKVVVTGTVVASDGTRESVSKSTTEQTFS